MNNIPSILERLEKDITAYYGTKQKFTQLEVLLNNVSKEESADIYSSKAVKRLGHYLQLYVTHLLEERENNSILVDFKQQFLEKILLLNSKEVYEWTEHERYLPSAIDAIMKSELLVDVLSGEVIFTGIADSSVWSGGPANRQEYTLKRKLAMDNAIDDGNQSAPEVKHTEEIAIKDILTELKLNYGAKFDSIVDMGVGTFRISRQILDFYKNVKLFISFDCNDESAKNGAKCAIKENLAEKSVAITSRYSRAVEKTTFRSNLTESYKLYSTLVICTGGTGLNAPDLVNIEDVFKAVTFKNTNSNGSLGPDSFLWSFMGLSGDLLGYSKFEKIKDFAYKLGKKLGVKKETLSNLYIPDWLRHNIKNIINEYTPREGIRQLSEPGLISFCNGDACEYDLRHRVYFRVKKSATMEDLLNNPFSPKNLVTDAGEPVVCYASVHEPRDNSQNRFNLNLKNAVGNISYKIGGIYSERITQNRLFKGLNGVGQKYGYEILMANNQSNGQTVYVAIMAKI